MSNISIREYVNKPNVQGLIQEVLGEKSTQFATNLVQVVNQNNMLKNADQASVLGAAITATLLELNLNPSLGHAYIVPFNNKQPDGQFKVMAQFILGYKGLKQLAIRSGQFRSLDTKPVFEGQYVEDESFIGYHFDWKAKKSDKIEGYACRFELLNGFEKIFYMTVDQIHAHGKKYSKTYSNKSGQWSINFDGMAMKTVTKLCLNSGEAPLSIDIQKAIKYDQSVIDNPQEMEYIDYVDSTDQPILVPEIEKPEFTELHFDQATAAGATIEMIREGYTTTAEIEMQYTEYVGAKK